MFLYPVDSIGQKVTLESVDPYFSELEFSIRSVKEDYKPSMLDPRVARSALDTVL